VQQQRQEADQGVRADALGQAVVHGRAQVRHLIA
jgi:hypothetical protein